MSKTKSAAAELAVLLPELSVGPYVLKPWSFGRFKKVLPALLQYLVPALRQVGLSLDNLLPDLEAKWPEVVQAVVPGFTPLIAATLDVPEAAVDGLSFDLSLTLGAAILAQNFQQIKNSWPLLLAQFQTMTGANLN